MSQKTIGILGGTFDPIHWGHIKIAEHVLNVLHLDTIHFIPCFKPAHRSTPIASADDRLNMVEIALKDKPQLIVDDREYQRHQPSYMIDTLRSLRGDFPNSSLSLIMGVDQFAKIETWHQWESLLTLCHFIVINRPDVAPQLSDKAKTLLSTQQTTDQDILRKTQNGKIFLLEIPPIPISATQIRDRLVDDNNEQIKTLPSAVLSYIQQHKIYRTA